MAKQVAPKDARVGSYHPRVVVKFRDRIELPYDATVEKEIERRFHGAWTRLAEQFKGISMAPLFASKKADEIRDLTARAEVSDPSYHAPDFLGYFVLNVPGDAAPETVARIVSQWPSVEKAYVEPKPVEPPLVNAADDPRSMNQGYLDAAPDGIDAEYAWLFAGGDGANQALVDLEWGWTLNHEDLAAHNISIISGLNNSFFFHGSGVLGEICAVDNMVGCVGVTPKLGSVRVVGQWLSGGGYSTSQPILDAIAVMNFGDVLLLEAQTSFAGYVKVPVEIEPAVFDVIRLATALGVVVVEAGGNGGVDLDTVSVSGELVFNRASADFKDSGAIIVGAGSSTAPHTRLGFSCFGSRIDCYGWGENVDTLSSDNSNVATNLYTTGFNGTSSASPIVTGAALAVQGLAQAALGHRFAPWQLRQILSNPANGTPSQTPAVDRIGVMPNLRAIIDGDVLSLAPDVYLRDFVGDSGDAHMGAISASPDVILRQNAVADPQAAFGQGSGVENSATLGYEAEAGQDNFVYVRMRNRGGSAANNVEATVFWAPPSTLLTPDQWNPLGSTTLPSVPTGDQLTVSDAIQWQAADIPAPGHYCFVALIGATGDPAPAPADFLDWDNFRSFIRNNNNVTWRNFNVVNNTPPAGAEPPGFVAMPFLMAGAPDKARRMRLEIASRLPVKAEAMLEMPLEWAELVKIAARPVKGADRERRGVVAIKSAGRTAFADVVFPAKARIPMRLLVKIPEDLRKQEFEIYARQMYGDEEVGRVTWRLAPPRKPQ